MDRPYSLNKSERLKSRKIINALFAEGQSEFQYPLKCLYMRCTVNDRKSGSLLFATTVSKRNFKQAVKRNLIKRHIREAYRLNKPQVSQKEHGNYCWVLMYIYISKNQEDTSLLSEAMDKINKKILKRIEP